MVFVNLCENRAQSQRSAFSGSPLSPLDCYEHFIIEFNPNTCCKKTNTYFWRARWPCGRLVSKHYYLHTESIRMIIFIQFQ